MTVQAEFTHHFSSQFNQELENLRSRVIAMGSAVEHQIVDAVAALEKGNENMARSVIGADLHVNALEVYLDEECGRILARRQPAAGDLRLIFAVIKTVTDIERIGDQAKGVARMAIKMAEANPDRRGISLQRLGELVREMVHNALSAFSGMDVDLTSPRIPSIEPSWSS
jgi:phosphate transport system protein